MPDEAKTILSVSLHNFEESLERIVWPELSLVSPAAIK